MMKICPSIAVHWIAEGSPETKYMEKIYIFVYLIASYFQRCPLNGRQKFLLKYIQKNIGVYLIVTKITSFTSTNVKLRLRFDIHLTFH